MGLLQYVLSQHPQDSGPATQFGCLGPCACVLQAALDTAMAARASLSASGLATEQVRAQVYAHSTV